MSAHLEEIRMEECLKEQVHIFRLELGDKLLKDSEGLCIEVIAGTSEVQHDIEQEAESTIFLKDHHIIILIQQAIHYIEDISDLIIKLTLQQNLLDHSEILFSVWTYSRDRF